MSFINTIPLLSLIWAIPLIQMIHELEEWNIFIWYKKYFIKLPDISNLRFRIWILFFSLFEYVWITLCFFVPNTTVSAILVSFLIMLNLMNGFQHVYWVFLVKNYAPGILSFIFLILPVESYTIYRFVSLGYLPYWAVIVIPALMIPVLISTVIAGNKMTSFVKTFVHDLPGKLLDMFAKE